MKSAGARRGHARRTRQCYGAWAARYGGFAKSAQSAMEVETATAFLTSLVEDEECAFATQKQALNALAFFFNSVCGVEEPRFDVRLRKTGPRVPTVLSREEVQGLMGQLEGRYVLAARLQYGAGLRLGELVSLRVAPWKTAERGELGMGTGSLVGGASEGGATNWWMREVNW